MKKEKFSLFSKFYLSRLPGWIKDGIQILELQG